MNKPDSLVREVVMVSIGEIVVTALMFGIFALGGFWSPKVLWGGLLGCVLTIAYYAFAALGVAMASKKAVNQDVTGGKRTLQISMLLRFILLLVVLVMALKGGLVNPIALVVPLLLFRPIVSVCEFFRKSGDKHVN